MLPSSSIISNIPIILVLLIVVVKNSVGVEGAVITSSFTAADMAFLDFLSKYEVGLFEPSTVYIVVVVGSKELDTVKSIEFSTINEYPLLLELT